MTMHGEPGCPRCGGVVGPKSRGGGSPKVYCSAKCAKAARDARSGRFMRYRELHGDEISRKRAERYRANPEPARKRAREYHRRHASAKRAARYGLSLADLEGLYAAQGGCCAACGASVEWLGRSSHVDHCHERGVVRGILCHNCNTALGLLRDSRERLAALDAYLERTA